MKNCTGIFCPMQYGKVDPATCQAADSCSHATPPKTNADRIRAMTDEELAFLISNGCPPASVKPCRAYLSIDGDTNCADCWLDWLKQEASE